MVGAWYVLFPATADEGWTFLRFRTPRQVVRSLRQLGRRRRLPHRIEVRYDPEQEA